MKKKFKVGDRVAYYEWPTDCGTVTEVLENGPAGAEYAVDWDHHRPTEPLVEAVLVPCSVRPQMSD